MSVTCWGKRNNKLPVVACSDTEKSRWRAAFGQRKFAEVVRMLLHEEADMIEMERVNEEARRRFLVDERRKKRSA